MPSIRYFGVRVNSDGLPNRPSSTAIALLRLMPMPIPSTAGMYFSFDFHVAGNCSFCESA